MIKGKRLNSFSREKTQILQHQSSNLSQTKSKNPTNPSNNQKKISKYILNRSDDTQHLPVYRVTKTKFEKNQLRYSDNSPLKTKEKIFQLSAYHQNEFEAYNFGYLGPIHQADRKKKGRSYFYKRDEQKRQNFMIQNSQNIRKVQQNQLTKSQNPQQIQAKINIQKKSIEDNITIEQMHYQMVKTFQKCKNMQD